ncbi:MAG: HEAT repeat domain-containing protein [Anaerolineales bacterium]
MSSIEISTIISEFTCGSDYRAEKAAIDLSSAGLQNLSIFNHLLTDQRAEVRWWAIRSLAEVQSPQATPLLINSLSDSDISVRQCAALAMQHQPDPLAIPVLIQLLDSTDQLLARLAGDALIAMGSDAVPALLEVMREGNLKIRIEAARALGKIGDTRAISELFKALDGESAVLEHWAGEGLERMGIGMVFYQP